MVSLRNAFFLAFSLLAFGSSSAVDLADAPLFTTVSVPGNMALALSVEWPTATTPSHLSTTAYANTTKFVGYFDTEKCYTYVYNSTTPSSSYFQPDSYATNRACTSSATKLLWSGNYLNWASMQTLDVFRWALTGGYRSTDTLTDTILTKTFATEGLGGSSVTPDKTVSSSTIVPGATPFSAWTKIVSSITQKGISLWFTSTGTIGSTATDYNGHNTFVKSTNSAYANAGTIYRVYINVKVCDKSVGVESNCIQYGSNYKPEGLMQKYADKLRFSAFGYLNDSDVKRDGGVLRAPMKFIGPKQNIPGSDPVANASTEWDPSTGIMYTNPDSAIASDTTTATGVTITQSGVMNYLNKFGLTSTSGDRYKSYDPVSELYYAVTRYFRKVGNVASYTAMSSANAATKKKYLDGFPIVTTWKDPILYSCQKNFILGIGDVNTHRDRNLPGANITSSDEPSMPTELTTDASTNGVNVAKSTKMVGQLEGISNLDTYSSGRNNSFYMAGLAYDIHTVDMRSDLPGPQTVNTYWLDVMENQAYSSKNQYWLAAKYGGFTVPTGFKPYATTNGTKTIALADWYSTTDKVGSDQRPDNYFTANKGEVMVDALNRAFAKIAMELSSANTTTFAAASRNSTASGNANYSASYDPSDWTGKVVGSTITYDSDLTPSLSAVWDARSLLQTLDATTGRKIVTCCTAAGAGLEFTSSALGGSLDARTYVSSFSNVPGVASGSQSRDNFIAYLRGDHSKEQRNGGPYRNRTYRLGDIVNSKVTAVAAPVRPYYDSYNPGYSAFKSTYASRKTVVYVGSNDGMMHAFNGSLTDTNKGLEMFAYIPSFAYGNSSSSSDRYFATYGLAALGNPNFVHRYMVDATPLAFDIDMNNTAGASSSTPNWRTVLIGGMGKGGKGYYAIDITDPTSWTTQSAVAGKVLWEFTDSRMGYSFADARVVKTAKYGWVVLLSSGYNNSDGAGYLFVVNPRTGKLLEAISTPASASKTTAVNLGQLRAFIPKVVDYTADVVYAGDLQGNLWRFDLTATTGSYPEPMLMAKLTDPDGNAQPITTAPMVGVDPTTRKRYVMVGTGKLLADSDITASQAHAFYAFVDGTGTSGGFYTKSTLPTGYSYPLTRSQLAEVEDLGDGLVGNAAAQGWYFNYTGGMTVDGDVYNGIVTFGVNVPGGDVCSPSGTSVYYAIRFASALSALVDSSGNLIKSVSNAGGTVTEISVQNIDNQIVVVAGDSGGKVQTLPVGNLSNTLQRLNWREISTITLN